MNIELSVLQEYSHGKEAILSLCSLSKSKLKTFKLSKKFLESPVKKRRTLSLPCDLVNQGKVNGHYSGPKVQVLIENNDVIILNKPPRVHTHPLSYSDTRNCLSFLINEGYIKSIQSHHGKYSDSFINRLDWETSGVLVYVKDRNQYHEIRKKFDDYVLEKNYLAIVNGLTPDYKKLNHYLSKSGPKGSVVTISKDPTEQEAFLEIHRLSYNKEQDLSLIKVALKTGHRHQIRVQLNALGHSLLGDSLYGGREASRLFLHAYEYTMTLAEKEFKYKAPIPTSFFDFFNFDSNFQVLN